MKKLSIFSMSALVLMILGSCEAVETVFKAGMWWGIIIVVFILGIILWIFSKGKK